MNNINFVKPVSPRQYHSIRRWHSISLLLAISSLCAMIAISLAEFFHLQAVKEQKNLIANHKKDANINKQVNLEKEYQIIKQREDFAHSFSNKRQNYVHALTTIQSALAKISLESIQIHENRLAITIKVPTIAQAHKLLGLLEKEALFYEVKLSHLYAQQSESLTYQITLEAKLRQLV